MHGQRFSYVLRLLPYLRRRVVRFLSISTCSCRYSCQSPLFYHYFFVERLIAGNFIGDQEFKFHSDGSPLALAVALTAFLHGPLIAIELTSVRLLSFFIRHQMA